MKLLIIQFSPVSHNSPQFISDKVDFFNPSNRTMALGSTQSLTEMSTRNLPGG
jgi:hypothetical protein